MLSQHQHGLTLPERLALGSVLIHPVFQRLLQREREMTLNRLGLIDPSNNDKDIAEEYRRLRCDLDWVNDLTKLAVTMQMGNTDDVSMLQTETVRT